MKSFGISKDIQKDRQTLKAPNSGEICSFSSRHFIDKASSIFNEYRNSFRNFDVKLSLLFDGTYKLQKLLNLKERFVNLNSEISMSKYYISPKNVFYKREESSKWSPLNFERSYSGEFCGFLMSKFQLSRISKLCGFN